MSVFHLEVTTHGDPRQFGDTSTSERCVLIGVLQTAAQWIGAGRPIGNADKPEPLIVGGQIIGKFWLGADAHSAKG